MFSRKCRGCAEKVDKKFNYCPYCGASMKARGDDDFGMLGTNDSGQIGEDLRLPFGIEKIMGSLVKQLEKQLSNMDMNDKAGMPKGFKIQIARGPMGQQVVRSNVPKKRTAVVVSEEEANRRAGLKKVDALSKVKRIGDTIIYEIEAPGISKKEDVVVTELETGIEIRVYAKDRCYVKIIPLKVEILGVRIDKERVLVELRGD